MTKHPNMHHIHTNIHTHSVSQNYSGESVRLEIKRSLVQNSHNAPP